MLGNLGARDLLEGSCAKNSNHAALVPTDPSLERSRYLYNSRKPFHVRRWIIEKQALRKTPSKEGEKTPSMTH
jgi:hypothetical protein